MVSITTFVIVRHDGYGNFEEVMDDNKQTIEFISFQGARKIAKALMGWDAMSNEACDFGSPKTFYTVHQLDKEIIRGEIGQPITTIRE